MCGIYDYRARRVLFAVQLQDRGEHRARYVTAYETFENVVITLFYFEQGTDENYHDFLHYLIILQRLDSLFQAQSGLPRRDLGRCPLSGAGDLPR